MTPHGEAYLRAAVRAGRRLGTPEAITVADLAALALDAEGLAPETAVVTDKPRTSAERTRRWREKRHAVTGERHGDVTGGVGGNLSSDPSENHKPADKAGEKKSEIPAESDRAPLLSVTLGDVTSVTESVTRVTRKTPKTHCPGPEEAADKVDAWCRSHKLPPASEVAEVRGMLLWHQKNGVPRASWLATWRDWQRSPLRDAQASRPPWKRPEVEGNPNPVTEAFELTAYDEARIARAREKKQRAGGGT